MFSAKEKVDEFVKDSKTNKEWLSKAKDKKDHLSEQFDKKKNELLGKKIGNDQKPFFLYGRRRRRYTEIDSMGREANELLYGYYVSRLALRFKLNPEENFYITSNFTDDGNGNIFGNASAFHESENIFVKGKLSTSAIGKPFNFSFRFGHPTLLQRNYLFGKVTGDSTAAIDTCKFNAGVGFRSNEISWEAAVTSESVFNGWVFAKFKKFGFGVRGAYDMKTAQQDKLECMFQYKNAEASGEPGRPSFYELAVRASDMGRKFSASYVQHMKVYSQLTDINHNVSMGGEFVHTNDGDQLTNVITVGGSWQVTENTLIKGTVDTTNQLNLLTGIKFGKVPLFTTTANIGFDLGQGPALTNIGFRISVEN